MSRENGDIQGLWSVEEDVVPMASATALETPSTNGDRADRDRDDEHPPAPIPAPDRGRVHLGTDDAEPGTEWPPAAGGAGSTCSRVGS